MSAAQSQSARKGSTKKPAGREVNRMSQSMAVNVNPQDEEERKGGDPFATGGSSPNLLAAVQDQKR